MKLNQKIYDIKMAFLEACKKYQNNIALKLEDKVISYKDLYLKAVSLIYAIEKQHNNCSMVGIMSQRNEAAFISVAASVIAQKTYVPLNPRFPDNRLKSMIVTSGLELIVTDSQNKQKLVNIVKLIERNIIIINYDDIQQLLFQDYSHLTTIDPSFDKNRTCYLLFTSGSTGIPKGVPISNANLCSFLSNANRCFPIDGNDILSQTFDLSFDLSMFDIFMSWLNGATLCVMSSLELLNPTDYIIRNKITLWFSVPSLIANVKALKKYNNLYSLRLSLFCGEALYLNDILFWQSIAPKSLIKNLYGPTEATIACSSYKWNNKSKQECSEGIISIGKIFKNLKYIILKEDYKTEVSIGELGELCFVKDGSYTIEKFLERFNVIFTLNQDLLLERCYRTSLEQVHPQGQGPNQWNPHNFPGVVPIDNLNTPDFCSKNPPRYTSQSDTNFKLYSSEHQKFQPIIKLHGSSNWYHNNSAKQLLIMGGNKERAILRSPLLKWYQELLKEYLNKKNTKLMIIGYSFSDSHINSIIIEAIKNYNLELFVIVPSGSDVVVKNRYLDENDRAIIENAIVGVSRRILDKTFKDAGVEYSKINRFFE